MKRKKETTNRKGVALLVVLLIVMTATILSLGFLSRSDVELACGENMLLRTQMDYLAESGLAHAKGLILSPQDVSSEYWTGDTRQQLVANSSDYYDVNVVKVGECNYQITCETYREKGGEKVGRSGIKAELRLDPCIAFWAAGTWMSEPQSTVNGDVYCTEALKGNGDINGDAYATWGITALYIEGHKNEWVTQAPIDWPGLVVSDFSSNYYIGSSTYSVHIVDSNVHTAGNFNPSASNPAGVRYHSGDFELPGGVNINGMLVVDGNLMVTGANNYVTSVKNFPALLISGEVIMENGGTLAINGLAQIGERIYVNVGAANVNVNVVGGLFIANGNIDGLNGSSPTNSFTITAAPNIASIEVWPEADVAKRWSPVGGGFFRSIARN